MTSSSTNLLPGLTRQLRSRISGELITAGDPSYDDARRLYLSGFDRRPLAIVRPISSAEVAQVVTANFNAANQLKRMDGGVFAATSESGEPILDNDGGIIGASLEASNTDISEEFTKLIITQQAYAAGTRIVSSADEMLQEALNMVR